MLKTFKLGFIVPFVSLAFIGCSESDVFNQKSSSVNYRNLSINFFDASIQKIDGASTRGDDEVALSKFFDRLDVALIPSGQTDNIYRFNQLSSEDNFGKLSVTVPVGTYDLVGVANKKDGETTANIKSKEFVNFTGNKVGDVASTYSQVEVKEQTESSAVACQLKRVVALFRLSCLDDIPKDVAAVTLSIEGKCNFSLNPSTSSAAAGTKGVDKSWKVSAYSDEERKNKSFDTYVFLASDTESVNIKVTLWGDADKTKALKTFTFSDVILKVNHMTTYTGKVFEAGDALSFSFSDGEMTSSGADKSF